MKKITIIITVIFLVLIFSISAIAGAIPDERTLPLLVDNADLLNSVEELILLKDLEEISELYECEVAIVTVDSTDSKDIVDYTDDFYDYNGYGYGQGDDGIMLLLCMETREYAISTYGFAISAFPRYLQDAIMDGVIPDLSDGDYSDAFGEFASQCGYYLESARNGDIPPENVEDWEENDDMSQGGMICLSVVVGIIISAVTMLVMKSQYRAVRFKPTAHEYVKQGSFNLVNSNDIFLYKNVVRTVKRTESSSGSSGTHRSSSGRSHGGSRGRF